MCDFLASDGLQARLVPGPSLERGHALSVKAHPKEPKLIYCFGKYVIVRSLNDAGDNFVYRGHKHAVGAAAFAPNGFWVASGDANGFLRVWAWDNPEHILKVEVQVFAGAIKDIQWDGESKRIVVVGAGSNIKTKCVMWDTGNAVGEMVGHQKTVLSVAYRQQRPFRIFTGGEDFKCVFYKGPPFKRALRTLVQEKLRRIIQDSVDGHDSKEDALACLDLMKAKAVEEMRTMRASMQTSRRDNYLTDPEAFQLV